MGRRSYCKGLLLVCLLLQSGCFMPYVLTQAYYQVELISGAKPVRKAVLDPKLSEHNRHQLMLISALKRFSVLQMGMKESPNYSTINPKWNRNLYVVSGSKELAFEPYIWNFPIIGKVPYLGHFNQREAIAMEARLKAKGYDTMLRPVAGYSTLGYFNDPIWPQMLGRSIHSLAELILHELAHSTLWFNGQSDFNESFANFVGRKGALLFIERNYGSHSPELMEAIAYMEDDDRVAAWLVDIHNRLNNVYTTTLTDAEKRQRKSEILAEAQGSFKSLHFRSRAFSKMNTPELNNASLMMSRRYNTGQDEFEKLLEIVNHNWTEFYLRLRSLQGKPDPFLELRKLVK